ncbi:protein GRINL1A [Diretmus argenteus]
MLRYGSVGTVTTTTTTEDSPEPFSERRIRRLRLTLHAGENGAEEPKHANSVRAEKDKVVNGAWKKKNGLIQRERPAGRESPEQHLGAITNGVQETSPQHRGPMVYGVVQRTGSNRQQEVMAREWSVNHLQDEMRYIREVRDSLEKVRERMYGQFGGMQQSMQKLSQEIRTANSQRRSLESEVRVRTAAMDSFDQMNSSLISANIDLQKSLLENSQNRLDMRNEVKSLRNTCGKTEEKLKEKEMQLAAAQAENRTLKLKVESSQEASSQTVQEVTERLQREYGEKLMEEQRKHREEIENLQAQIDEYIRRLEEAERNAKIAEDKIAERDQRISEVERLLDCMGQEKSDLQKKLQECERRLRVMELTDKTNATVAGRSKQLEEETSDLRDRIKHLNDMVFCQQRKVKGMIEEVQSLRAQVAQKDVFISELLDRIAIVECENNELEDSLKYFVSIQNRPRETREIGVGCDLLPRSEVQEYDVESTVQSEPTQYQPMQYPSLYLKAPTRTFKSNPPPSRLESSLLKYSPVEYSRFLQSNPSSSRTQSDSMSPVKSSTDGSVAAPTTDTGSSPEESAPSRSSSRRQGQVGDLRCRSEEELCEILSRQEKMLANKRFLHSLPDKGAKIFDFAERVRLAIAHHHEEERKQSMLSSARTELQSKYQQAFTSQLPAIHNSPGTSNQSRQGEDAAVDVVQMKEASPVSAHVQESNTLDEQKGQFVSTVAAGETMETDAAGASLNLDETKESDLVEALERVKLSETASTGFSRESKESLNSSATDNFFLGKQPPKKPHYISVLEKTEKVSATRRQKFKPNQLAPRSDNSGSMSPSQSPGGSSPLSAQERKERDRKHLDDITAARLPPLIHNSAQLLSLDESASLLREQTKKHQELQAKMAAQKLSEGLRISMVSYTPDSGPMAAYRELHDDGAQLSSEED